jgi:hypothetical protein
MNFTGNANGNSDGSIPVDLEIAELQSPPFWPQEINMPQLVTASSKVYHSADYTQQD